MRLQFEKGGSNVFFPRPSSFALTVGIVYTRRVPIPGIFLVG